MSPRPIVLAAVALVACAASALAQPAATAEPAQGEALATPDASAEPGAAKAAMIARYDDGEWDVSIQPDATTFEVAMLFQNIGGPDVTLGGVQFAWRQFTGDPRIRYEVVVWRADGVGGIPGTELASFAAVANGAPQVPTYFTTSFSYPLADHDVYVGVRWNPLVDPGYGFSLDDDGLGGAPAQPAFWRRDESGPWQPMSNQDSHYKALMIRAFVSTPGVVSERLVVPSFLVDRNHALGTSTLFAVRNLTDHVVSADLDYFTAAGDGQRHEELTLDPYATKTVNVRDVSGLATDGDGFDRGYVRVTAAGRPDMTPVLAGDFFQVDLDGSFATGDKLFRELQLCTHASVRFLHFPLPGSGTRLALWIRNPRGTGPGSPVSFTVQPFDEAGVAAGSPVGIKTTKQSLELDASDFSSLPYGTLRFDFSNSAGGNVYAEATAHQRFAVGVTAQCDEIP